MQPRRRPIGALVCKQSGVVAVPALGGLDGQVLVTVVGEEDPRLHTTLQLQLAESDAASAVH